MHITHIYIIYVHFIILLVIQLMLYGGPLTNKLKFSYTHDNFCLSQWEL